MIFALEELSVHVRKTSYVHKGIYCKAEEGRRDMSQNPRTINSFVLKVEEHLLSLQTTEWRRICKEKEPGWVWGSKKEVEKVHFDLTSVFSIDVVCEVADREWRGLRLRATGKGGRRCCRGHGRKSIARKVWRAAKQFWGLQWHKRRYCCGKLPQTMLGSPGVGVGKAGGGGFQAWTWALTSEFLGVRAGPKRRMWKHCWSWGPGWRASWRGASHSWETNDFLDNLDLP